MAKRNKPLKKNKKEKKLNNKLEEIAEEQVVDLNTRKSPNKKNK